MASASPTRSSSRVLAGRVLAGRMFAALRQGWSVSRCFPRKHRRRKTSQSCILHLVRLICSTSFPPEFSTIFNFNGSSVEVNFTSFYRLPDLSPIHPLQRAQRRQVFVARRRLRQRRWKPMWGNSERGSGMPTKSGKVVRCLR